MSQTKMVGDREIEGAEDLISNLPDEILQHILCSNIPTKLAISTSILSRRWRHVWCEVPSLSLFVGTLTTAASVNKTLTRYTAPKTKSFHLRIEYVMKNMSYIYTLIKFAMSHNVENLSLDISSHYYQFKFPDFVYSSSSIKQLNITLILRHWIVPECTVSWTSLQKLSLTCCRLSDESMAKILSGCPVLEKLTLYHCRELEVLDLGKSPRLRALEVIIGNMTVPLRGPRQIVAPHIHYLRFLSSELSCTLVDVASLTEAELEISSVSLNSDLNFPFLHFMVLKMLDKLKNAEKLKLGSSFIQILSKIGDAPFPTLKVKALTLDTKICQYVIPGIERLLKNSPDLDLETLKVRGRTEELIATLSYNKNVTIVPMIS
ncbi:unnamed protein product [Eruca vesicaria subsp. sativa]|uniref:At1g61320/AtMIF1 LRR domain-containing protein n=1 Tax=Eruca vesicaria subsp. sativa TaxID=29727 RepID=A0ABC8L4S1_ERUVS|nr:unnamed protein product [Eruca vesicaria subsp. sativa]